MQTVLGTGAAEIAAAGKAVAAAAGSGAFSVDPAVVDSMIKKLIEMAEELGSIRRRSRELSPDTKLGGGYAEVISKASAQFGETAATQIQDAIREVNALKTQIEKSRASYQAVDQAHSDSLKNLDGKS
ncbi:MAG TPA: hypothetical protein VF821_18400 [Lentzea sp.]